jgi:hypothetical protein
MSETRSPRRVWRSIGAVLAGALSSIIPSLATDWALQKTGVVPAPGQSWGSALLLLATTYRTVYGIAGSYLAARLAPHRPMAHSMALGVAGLVASTAGAVATWNGGPEFEPKWYPVALIVLALPTAWAGGCLFLMRRRDRL